MNIAIFRSGNFTLVTGAWVTGKVLCLDAKSHKADGKNSGDLPIYELDSFELAARNSAAKRLPLTENVLTVLEHGAIQLIAKVAPSNDDGSAESQYAMELACTSVQNESDFKVVVDNSAALRGAVDKVSLILKPSTKDMRETPSRCLNADQFEATITVEDCDDGKRIFGDELRIFYADSAMAALSDADALAGVTERREIRNVDLQTIALIHKMTIVFDGRDLYESAMVAEQGIAYCAIGPGRSQ